MTITFLIRTLGYGGAERQLVALARGLHQRGHRVRVIVFYGGGPLDADLRAAGVPLTALGKRGRWDLPRFLVRLVRVLRADAPEVVHGYLATSNLLALVTKPLHGARVVWGVRASDIDLRRDPWVSRAETRIERWLSRWPDLIIANSHAGRDHVVKTGFLPSKITVIPNGIDTDRFRCDPVGRQAVRTELGIAEDQPLIGRVGRLAPQKDYPTFLRAAAHVAASRPEARFLCVGDGSPQLRAQLRLLASQLGLDRRVYWSAGRDDMPAVYSALDVVVSSSAYGEGTPNVVAEAMACGVPCVVTDVGDSARTVGETGVVVPPGDAEALARGIQRVLDHVTRGEVSRALLRDRVERQLSLEHLIERTEAALRSIMAGGEAG